MSAHTPGPWRVSLWDILEKDDWVVAHVESTPPTGDLRANARLIAAAPDLLEALEACDSAFAGWQVGGIPGRPEDILGLVQRVRTAIAKARGDK